MKKGFAFVLAFLFLNLSILCSSAVVAYPNITITSPGGILGNGSVPFISVITNETAYCEYKNGVWTPFQVTNSTKYHETILSGAGNYGVRCTNSAGNTATASTNVTYSTGVCAVNPSFILPAINANAGETVKANVNLSSAAAIGCAALHPSRFGLTVNNEQVGVSARHIATGIYLIQFQAPKEKGVFSLRLEVNGIGANSTLDTTASMNITVSTSAKLGMNTKHIIYNSSFSGYTLGIASDSSNTTRGINNLSANPADGSVYIFMTKPNADVEKIEPLLDKKEFSSYQNPSFGYNLKTGKYSVQARISYDGIQISGLDALYSGMYTVLIKNRGINQTTGKIMVELKTT